jgi:peptide/nickel transport system permease protein
MLQFLLYRSLHAAIVLCIVVVVSFAAVQLMPGDALLAAIEVTGEVADSRGLDAVRKYYGQDGNAFEQFFRWLGKFVRGDWGLSMGSGQAVKDMFLQRAPVTLELFFGGLIWALVIGIPVGMLCAFKRGTALDSFLSGGSLIGIALPPTFEALALIYLFAVIFKILPPSGYTPFFEDPWANIQSMLLPSFVIGSHLAGILARYVRSSLLDNLRQDFIRTARAKGLSEVEILFRHAVKPSMIPIVTVLGFTFGGMLAGAFIIEVIFALPGVGRMAVNAIFEKDFPVIQAVLVMTAINVLAVNFLVDIAYAALDPRIRIR